MRESLPSRQIRALARQFYRRGWMEGTAGNLSIKEGHTLYITASGRPKGALSSKDVLTLPMKGDIPSPIGPRRPSAETSIHKAIYSLIPPFPVHNSHSKVGAFNDFPKGRVVPEKIVLPWVGIGFVQSMLRIHKINRMG